MGQLVRFGPPQMEGFWSDLGSGVKFVVGTAANVVTAPIRLPIEAIKAAGGAASGIIGATGGLVRDVAAVPGGIIAGLRPQQQQVNPATLQALMGGGGSSMLPIALGGAAALGLLVFALTRRPRQ